MITTKNIRSEKNGVRCDRSSVLGNPFEMETEDVRELVVEGFRHYLWQVVKYGASPSDAALTVSTKMGLATSSSWKRPTREQLLSALDDLRNDWMRNGELTLLCWCKPKACHTDVIKSYLEYSRKEKSYEH